MTALSDLIAQEEAEDRLLRAKERAEQSSVYVVRATPSGNLKIGLAIDPVKRLRAMQTGTWETLTIIAIVAGDRKLEQTIHADLSEYHIVREWFRPDPAVVAWVKGMARPPRDGNTPT